ncbi:putative LRR receptor-like serine/threonine-protein kinase [Dichanthelium oligosanthes]|uniref:Putative LRR receptor-like serine/threonine-protein kinase n=1 Tax=Dichanthelium oligosanthes TaxID=888268 RepID=A0A1E5WD66_9POAL|nr:putative LRR receptor-like serine/threonine-protein kinase [Dichanthelium oligosanthes]
MLPRCRLAAGALFCLVVLLLRRADAASAQGPQQPPPLAPQDVAALHGLRASLGVRASDWPARADPCASWRGVTCRGGRVAELRLSGLRRTRAGALRAAFDVGTLRGLSALEVLNASGFPLPGWIPAWFGRFLPPSLGVVDLRSTRVNGELPRDLGMSGNLTTLVLSGNSLTGPIPASLFSIPGLRVLDLSSNNLTGPLPNVSFSGSGGAGVTFNASGNSLYGAIGDVTGSLRKRFWVVDVSRNYFDQGVGTGFENGTDGVVDLRMNCLSGVASQRSRGDCEAFYTRNGVRLEVPEPSSPLPEPQPTQVLPGPSTGRKGGKWKYVLAGVLAGAAIVVIPGLVVLVLCLMRRKGRRPIGRGMEQTDEGIRSGRRSSSVNPVTMSPMASPGASGSPNDVPIIIDEFTYEKLHHATGGFGDENLVKHGHSGDMYHGVLESGFEVVVKKIDLKSSPPASCTYDVYCFGKVLLELITGNFGMSGSNDADSDEWLARTLGYIDAYDKEGVSGIVDPYLVVDEDHLEEVWAVAIVAKTCLNPKPSRRPLARYILKALENPLRVVREREELHSNSSRLKSTSSRSSWRFAFHGNKCQSWDVMPTSGKALAWKDKSRSQVTEGSDEEDENSFSFKRASRENFPDPIELEDSVIV